ncbi:MAG TPA: DUF262 domain-containing protein [Kofleriaceae bacterium]|nr:DUF262 domain-containing protein [Kofleriaceae bacterium]
MVAVALETPMRPEARPFRVEDLVRHALAGKIRVPAFQRDFKWERADVEKLFDSIWRGYPIGTLLLWSRTAPPGKARLGAMELDVREEKEAWFVIDGQQRIVSLVSTLHPTGARGELFDLYFDLVRERVSHPQGHAPPPQTHLPLDRVVDSEQLLRWIDQNRLGLTPEQVRSAIRIGRAIREYEIPAYVVHVEDESVVREIYARTNSTGKALDQADIFRGLHAVFGGHPSVSLTEVVDRLRTLSFGEIEEVHVLRSLLAIERRDPSGDLQRQLTSVDIPAAVARTEQALARVVGFLVQDAGIPHLRLLPYKSPLAALTAYFDRFADPSSRARRLLTRWLWRGTIAEDLRGDGQGMRPALDAAFSTEDAETAAQRILGTVSWIAPLTPPTEPFNLRYARSKLLAIALADLRPRHLVTGELIDVAQLLSTTQDFLPQLFGPRAIPQDAIRPGDSPLASVGNRMLHPTSAGQSLASVLVHASPDVLASHGVTAAAHQALARGDRLAFIDTRRSVLEQHAARLMAARAEWEHTDRISIERLSEED